MRIKKVTDEVLKDELERRGFCVVADSEAEKYVNIEKSMGTEPFYELLVDAIDKGFLSLEMLIGKVALKKLMDATVSQSKKK